MAIPPGGNEQVRGAKTADLCRRSLARGYLSRAALLRGRGTRRLARSPSRRLRGRRLPAGLSRWDLRLRARLRGSKKGGGSHLSFFWALIWVNPVRARSLASTIEPWRQLACVSARARSLLPSDEDGGLPPAHLPAQTSGRPSRPTAAWPPGCTSGQFPASWGPRMGPVGRITYVRALHWATRCHERLEEVTDRGSWHQRSNHGSRSPM